MRSERANIERHGVRRDAAEISEVALTRTHAIRSLTRRVALGLTGVVSLGGPALAQTAEEMPGANTLNEPLIQAPADWGTRFQPYATDIMREIQWFEAYTLVFLIPIGLLVGGLLGYAIWRYNADRNPVASRTSHNTTIEVVWTVAPVLVLLFLAVPSFQLLSAQFDPPGEPELTIKATGYQWYWGYEYQNDETGEAVVSFDSIPLLKNEDREPIGKSDMNEYPNLLAVDNELVVPEDTVVRVLVTAGDVLHSWTVPSFGKKMDAIPGRLNETWFKVNAPGIYYGQCSELCGKDHAFMPIAVRVLTREDFATWYATAAEGGVSAANAALMASLRDARAPKVAAAPLPDTQTAPVAN